MERLKFGEFLRSSWKISLPALALLMSSCTTSTPLGNAQELILQTGDPNIPTIANDPLADNPRTLTLICTSGEIEGVEQYSSDNLILVRPASASNKWLVSWSQVEYLVSVRLPFRTTFDLGIRSFNNPEIHNMSRLEFMRRAVMSCFKETFANA